MNNKELTLDLLNMFRSAGFTLSKVWNGCEEEKYENDDQFIACAMATDECGIRVSKDEEIFNAYLLYGNADWELVCDYSYVPERSNFALFENTIGEFSDKHYEMGLNK